MARVNRNAANDSMEQERNASFGADYGAYVPTQISRKPLNFGMSGGAGLSVPPIPKKDHTLP
jgi:hypothetical protein